jgi:hypothetical protein
MMANETNILPIAAVVCPATGEAPSLARAADAVDPTSVAGGVAVVAASEKQTQPCR